jgi:hypothetical protein
MPSLCTVQNSNQRNPELQPVVMSSSNVMSRFLMATSNEKSRTSLTLLSLHFQTFVTFPEAVRFSFKYTTELQLISSPVLSNLKFFSQHSHNTVGAEIALSV